eukprot:s4114_g5.t1
MILTWVGQAKTTEDIFLDAGVLNLRKRQLQLEAEIADLTDQVRKELPKAFSKSKEMHKSLPLSIVSNAKTNNKAGIWSSEECEASLNASRMYEASGLALWLQTGALGSSSHDDINWQSLEGFKEKFFSKRVAFQASVTRQDTTEAEERAQAHSDKEHLELLWEASLSVTLQLRLCPTLKDKSLARNLQSEAVKALGHASLSDSCLTFAGLVKVLAIEKVQDGAAAGLAYNGTVYNAAIHKAVLSLAGVLEDPGRHVEQSLSRLATWAGHSKLLAYGKSLSPSRSMVQGPRSNGEIIGWMIDMLVLAFKTKLRLPSKATEGWLDKDRKTGMIDMLVLAFKTKLRLPSKATEGWLDKDRKTGTPSYWQVSGVILQTLRLKKKSFTKNALKFLDSCICHVKLFLVRFVSEWFGSSIAMPCQVFEYTEKLVTKLPEPEIQKAKAVLEDLLSPLRCWEKFLEPDEKSLVDTGFLHEDDLEEEGACAVVVPSGPLAAMKENFNKATGQLFDLLLEVEAVAIRCPVQRTRIKVTKKETFTACGEESTYQGTYTGVAFRNTLEIPLVSLREKAKVMDPNGALSLLKAPEDWVERNGEDCPLFWVSRSRLPPGARS